MATMTGVIQSYQRVGCVHHAPAALLIVSHSQRILHWLTGPKIGAGEKHLFKRQRLFFRIVDQHASSFILVHK